MHQYYVYILANRPKGVLYVGITSDIIKRIWQHKSKQAKGFTKKYNVDSLVFFEIHEDVYAVLKREKRIKRWKREWKEKLIEKQNPNWRDLFYTLV